MLPSAGYFRSINCPYFNSGWCERPHCQFRHVKAEPSNVPTPHLVASGSTEVTISSKTDSPKAVPTKSAVTKHCFQFLTNIPVYTPTPISQLKNPAPTKPKYVITPPSKDKSEYDPLANFSAKKEVKDKRVKPNSDFAKSKKRKTREEYVPQKLRKTSRESNDDSLVYIPTKITKSPSPSQSEKADGDLGAAENVNESNVKNLPVEEPPAEKNFIEAKPSLSADKSAVGEENSEDEIELDLEEVSNIIKNYNVSRRASSDQEAIDREKTKKSPKKNHKSPEKKSDTLNGKHEKSRKSSETPSVAKIINPETPEEKVKVVSENDSKKLSSEEKVKDVSENDSKKLSTESREKTKESSEKTDSKRIHAESHYSKKSSSSKSRSASHSSRDSQHHRSSKKDSDGKHRSSNSDKHQGSSNHRSSTHRSSSSSSHKQHSNHRSSSSHRKESDGRNSRKSSSSDDAAKKKNQATILSNIGDILNNEDSNDSFSVTSGGPMSENETEWEHDVEDECLRIFNEYEAGVKVDLNPEPEAQREPASQPEEEVAVGKKRVAHSGANPGPKPPEKPSRCIIRPQQAMYNRFAQLQKLAQERKPETSTSASTIDGKKRVAYVPNVSALLSATTKMKSDLARRTVATAATPATTIQTLPKGEQRIARVPSAQVLKRPMIQLVAGNKVPLSVRQRYLNVFIDECLKIYDNEQDAYDRAVEEEKNACTRSSTKAVYINVTVNTIKRLRHEATEVEAYGGGALTCAASRPKNHIIRHEAVLGGHLAASTSFSIEKGRFKHAETLNSVEDLYRLLEQYIMKEEQLEQNGFPLPHPFVPGQAVINNARKSPVKCLNPLEKICIRCGGRYRVEEDGTYQSKEECCYHWGRAFKKRVAGVIDNRYTCCQDDLNSEGCCLAKVHVCDTPNTEKHQRGYVSTLEKKSDSKANHAVYSLDCEMCYTTMGNELTRLTVIGPDLKPAYETLVLPDNPIVDYNTRFSGITEEHMRGVKTTLRDVQAVLLSKFSDKTILIGHSLESDFKALKLFHKTVVDTSVVFPHRLGPPMKRALRNLMSEHLNKIIQNGLDGHDSKEDAVSCMELMLWKIKEDLKKT